MRLSASRLRWIFLIYCKEDGSRIVQELIGPSGWGQIGTVSGGRRVSWKSFLRAGRRSSGVCQSTRVTAVLRSRFLIGRRNF